MITEQQAILLAALQLTGRAHGHVIGKKYEELRQKSIPIASLYKALHALERDEFVEGEWERLSDVEVGRPRRRYYRITGLGERALRAFAVEHEATGRVLRPWSAGEFR